MLPDEHVHVALQHLEAAREDEATRDDEQEQIRRAEANAGDALALLTSRRERVDDCEVLIDDGGEQA